jgi:hypothetical protein
LHVPAHEQDPDLKLAPLQIQNPEISLAHLHVPAHEQDPDLKLAPLQIQENKDNTNMD